MEKYYEFKIEKGPASPLCGLCYDTYISCLCLVAYRPCIVS